ncbi:hypothetical protein IFM89_013672 [Coptis chinensis]|uniref:Uncharacterized protein n=1 Tax=Coptis chinensis TaxID=261450 RepID=A0A835IMW5_9MAGN|nr:hypothetical protein IFM89_013672 [Coptis chinensis]
MEEKAELVEGKVDWKGRTARKHRHGGMSISVLILAAFAFENMATFALSVNLITYFNGAMHYDIADAANALTNYQGTSYIITIVVAFLADTYIGRFKATAGLGLLTIQAHYSKLKPPPCNIFDRTAVCEKVSGGNAVLMFSALYLIAIGSGGIKAALPAHGADQFDEKDPKEVRQMSSYFNWFLLATSLGAAVSLTFIVWVQDNKGFDAGFGLSTVAMVLVLIVFVSGLPRYRIQVIKGTNALTEIFQVYVASIRNRKLTHPGNPKELYEIDRDKEAAVDQEFLPHRKTLRFLDKAAIQTTPVSNPADVNPWKLCRVTQVENAKIILGMIPIFCSTIIMSTCLAQLQTFSIQQGLTMDTRITNSFHIPPASLPIIPVAFLLIIIPFYDRIFVPFARKFTGHTTGITHLQRIGVGLVLSSMSMASAALLEVKRKETARNHGMLDAIPVLEPLPISVFWLSFQYFIFGIADLFTTVGLLEFFYSEAPKGLKSLSTCFLWSSMSLGYFFSTILIEIVNSATKNLTSSKGWLAGNNINKNHVNLFYWLLSLLSMINFFNYLFWAKRYKYRHAQVQVQPVDGNETNLSVVMQFND